MKKVLSVLVLIAVSISLSSCSVKKIKTTELNEYDEYLSKVEYAEDYMPSLEQCGNYSSFFATHKHQSFYLETETVVLFLSYNEDEYNKQKEAILLNYVFYDSEDKGLESDCDAVVDGYNIKLVNRNYPLETYKMGLLIGMDDANKKICYLFYYDFDLDDLDDLDAYVESYFYMS